MSNVLIAFFLAAGTGTWVYSKAFNSTGGNTKSALTAGGSVGGLVFLVSLIILSYIM